MRTGLVAAAIWTATAWPAAGQEPMTVFAAASLTDAMEAVGAAYTEATGEPVRFSFASSSTLARQIEAGAPAQIYASANQRWMDYLEDRGLIAAESRVSPIGNRLVLIAPAGDDTPDVTIAPDLDLAGLLGERDRLAVGDPDHVPAGLYAREALVSLGLWEALAPRLARADDVRAALALVARGEAPVGIVYATDAAVSDDVEVLGTFPADGHRPITYPFAVVAAAEARTAVDDLFAFMTGPEARAIYARFGFEAE
jgi:molybdate transport system substrate-binding protein